ncbi:MAG: flagellar biosynthesis anti-sigma factor FlgM [Burkholderiaceae bacterium]|nr:flagellar biosynthesis anti-sigma factor FlgM [Burkholderiaceae bacterium]
MKIGPFENKPAGVDRVAPSGAERKGEAGKTGQSGRSGSASATVALSSTAAELSQGGVSEASFDQAKVDRIAQAIRDGNYQINAEAIADKLISNAQELLGKTGG